MALTEAQQRAIVSALERKSGGHRIECPITRDSDWGVQNRLANIPATDAATESGFGDAAFPTAVLVCNTCGYTLLLNLFVLGIAEEFGLSPKLAADVSG